MSLSDGTGGQNSTPQYATVYTTPASGAATAGYAQDGERWLSDVRAHLSADQRAALRRLA